MKIKKTIIILLLFFLFFPSCKAINDLSGLTEEELPTTIEISITPNGGEIILPGSDGIALAKLKVPSGAVESTTTIGIKIKDIESTVASSLFELTPSGIQFEKPLELTIYYGDFIAESGLASTDICPYIISDSGDFSPLYNFQNNTAEQTLTVWLTHFSSVTSSKNPNQLSAADINEMASAFGIEISADWLEKLNTIYDTYVEPIVSPASLGSTGEGAAALKLWCDAKSDLQLASGWKGDTYITGYDLFTYANLVDYTTTPYTENVFTYQIYNNKGDVPAEKYYASMVCQELSIRNDELGVDGLQIFDIYLKQTSSNPQLEITSSQMISMDQDETYTLGGRLFFEYQPFGQEDWFRHGIPNERVQFSVTNGPGTVNITEVQTAADGTFSAVFTADWETSTEEPEISNVNAGFVRQTVFLLETLVVTESRDSLITSTSPIHNAADVPLDSAIVINFSEAMDLSSDSFYSISPAVAYTRIWSGGQTVLTLDPDADLDPNTIYTITLANTAVSQRETFLENDYIFSFTTEDLEHPEVMEITPVLAATDVPVNTTVVLTFSNPMNESVTENALSILPVVTGTYSWNTESTRITFIPDADLAENRNYSITISTEAIDVNGVELEDPFTSSFTTQGPGLLFPGEEGKLSVAYDDTLGLLLTWTKATDSFTEQSQLEYKIVAAYRNQSGSSSQIPELNTIEDIEINGTMLQDWTRDIDSAAVNTSTEDINTFCNVLVKNSSGYSACYLQRVIPVVYEQYPKLEGVFNNDILGAWRFYNNIGTYRYGEPDNIVNYQDTTNTYDPLTNTVTAETYYTGPTTEKWYSYGIQSGIIPVFSGETVWKYSWKKTEGVFGEIEGTYTRTHYLHVEYIDPPRSTFDGTESATFICNNDSSFSLNQELISSTHQDSFKEDFGTFTGEEINNITLNPYPSFSSSTFGIKNRIVWIKSGDDWYLFGPINRVTRTAPYDSTAPSLNSSLISTYIIDEDGYYFVSLSWEWAEDDISDQLNLKYKLIRSSANDIMTITDAETNGIVEMDWSVPYGDTPTSPMGYAMFDLPRNQIYYFNVIVVDEQSNKTIYSVIEVETPAE